MELKIPIEIVFDDVNSVIDELGKLQTYKLGAGDDMTLVDVDDVADVLTRHVMAREAKEPCRTKEGWIPCSERLPEKEGMYIVCFDRKQLRKNEYQIETSYWLDGKWQYGMLERYEHKMTEYVIEPVEYLTVTAWMPLPKPYGGESE